MKRENMNIEFAESKEYRQFGTDLDKMKIEYARKAIDNEGCEGCEHWKEDKDGFECMTKDEFKCEEHKIKAARTIIAALESELVESQTVCDETFCELNERNILIVNLEAERDEAFKEIGKQARWRGYAEQERDELQKKNTMMLSLLETQARTILSMRNCGNCADDVSPKEFKVCVGCHGYKDVDPEAKKTYLANWKPGKLVVK